MEKWAKEHLLKELSAGQLRESSSIEFKEQWQQDSGKSLSAIGNTEGGWLIIGVDDKGRLLGKDSEWTQKQQHKIENHIIQYLEPSAAVQAISVETVRNKFCLFIEIINQSLVSWNKKFYEKIGSSLKEMSPKTRKQMELERPASDFSNLEYHGEADSSLVLDFAKFLKTDNGNWTHLSADEVLSKLCIKNKNVSRILFGDFVFRLVHYNANSDVLDQKEEKGLYKLLKNDFIPHIQSWTRKKPLALRSGSISAIEEKPYSDDALREILVNAIAHCAFEKRGGGIKVELYPTRIEISNHCLPEAEAFINKRFSKDSFPHNPLLMKILRMAGFSEELGTGKSKIFKYVIEDGKREPVFEYKEMPKHYGIWSVTLYNEALNENILSFLKKLKERYRKDLDKYKLAAALTLWREKTLNEILSYMDEHHSKLTLEILTEDESPFSITSEELKSGKKSIRIGLKRWGTLKLKGQESKVFSEMEENKIKEVLRNYAYENARGGYITNKEVRNILGMSDSKSEQVQISRLFQKWEKEHFVEQGKKKGSWRIKQKFDDEYKSLLEFLRNHPQLKDK